MNNPAEQMIVGLPLGAEYEALEGLLQECNEFLDRWKASEPARNKATPDAIIAILTVQLACAERRSYILGQQTQEELPF